MSSARGETLCRLHGCYEARKAHAVRDSAHAMEALAIDGIGIVLDGAGVIAALGRVQLIVIAVGEQFAESLLGPRWQTLHALHNQPDVAQFMYGDALKERRGQTVQHRDAAHLGS